MKCKTGIAALAVFGAVPLIALAADPAPPQSGPTPSGPPPAMFKQLDANRDGYLTKVEAKHSADVTARFDKLDTNGDGRVSVQEYVEGTRKSS